MVQYILGNYLVETGKLTKGQLDRVISIQDNTRVKLGLIAVSEGLMIEKQTNEVNRLQAQFDKRFGDIAIEKGYLTDEQVGRLLKLQGNEYLAFVQTIVDEGLMSAKEIEDSLCNYQKEKGYGASEVEDLKSGDVERVLPLYLIGNMSKYLPIANVALKTVIRCIDRNAYIDEAILVKNAGVSNVAIQKIEGEKGWISAFAEAEGGMLSLASIFGKENFTKVDEDVLDAAGEFINCVNGLHASALSEKSIRVELLPPVYSKEETVIEGNEVCIISMYVQNKKLLFVVSQ